MGRYPNERVRLFFFFFFFFFRSNVMCTGKMLPGSRAPEPQRYNCVAVQVRVNVGGNAQPTAKPNQRSVQPKRT